MNKWSEILVGLILISIAVYAWGMNVCGFGQAAIMFLKGGIIWLVIMIALMLLLLGINDIKED